MSGAADVSHGPVAIGGVGGSGTRVVAAMLQRSGVHVGTDLNEALDNLWFTLLFKHRGVRDLDDGAFAARLACFEGAMAGPGCTAPPPGLDALLDDDREGQHPRAWLAARLETLRQARGVPGRWGWKEPNTHLVVDRLLAARPSLRYVHVMRNGLDMAFSGNQNQLRLWGPAVLGAAWEDTPRGSLAFWHWAHARIRQLAEAHPGRILVVDYDQLCEAPEAALPGLLAFMGCEATAPHVAAMAALVRPPASRGRFRDAPRSVFDPADVDFVRSLGYPVD